jgi:hypothetical protein
MTMYKLFYKSNKHEDDFYSKTIEDGLSLCNLSNIDVMSIGYAYKFLGMFWKIDPCIISHGQYKTLKQLSLEWFKS